MKKQQVITFHTDGSVSGLQVKPGQGLDLTSMGRAKVIRASKIEWDEDEQAWIVNVVVGPVQGPVSVDALADALEPNDRTVARAILLLDQEAKSGWRVGKSDLNFITPILFKSYPEAVQIEIAFLDGLRVQGRFTNQTT